MAAVAAVNLFALAVFVVLATIQYNAILSDLTRDRLVVLADTAKRPFQSVADLGIPIGTVRNADAVLARVASSDQAIIAIHAISPDGDIVRSTNIQDADQSLESALTTSLTADPDATWYLEKTGEFLVGANIEGAGGTRAGSIVIEYSKDGANLRLKAMEAQLVILAGLVLLGTLLAGYGVLRLVLSEHLRIFEGLLASFDRFERRFWRDAPGHGDNVDDVEGLGLSTAEFHALLDQSEQTYRQAKGQAEGQDVGGVAG